MFMELHNSNKAHKQASIQHLSLLILCRLQHVPAVFGPGQVTGSYRQTTPHSHAHSLTSTLSAQLT